MENIKPCRIWLMKLTAEYHFRDGTVKTVNFETSNPDTLIKSAQTVWRYCKNNSGGTKPACRIEIFQTPE